MPLVASSTWASEVMGVVAFYLWLQLLPHIPYVPATDRMAPADFERMRQRTVAASTVGCEKFSKPVGSKVRFRDFRMSINGPELPRCP